MKTVIVSLIALCAHLGLQAGTQTATSRSFGEFSIREVVAKTKANGDTIESGDPRVEVSLRLGSPNSVLPDGSWLYYGYSAQPAPFGAVHRGTLVVRFVDSRVSGLSLADQSTVVALRQSPRQSRPRQLLAVR